MKIQFLLIASLLVVSQPAQSQPPTLTDTAPVRRTMRPVERELALSVAKLCANEATLANASPADCALIWQVTESHGETAVERLRWLRGHSSCVLGNPSARRMSIGNCAWTRGLNWRGTEPEAWPEEYGAWSVYRERWRQMLNLCARLVMGEETFRPCETAPDTWGGNIDRERSERLGYTSVRCEGTRNRGYNYPPPAGSS